MNSSSKSSPTTGNLNLLLDERRSAHASIRGYLYQICLGVLRWLDLQPSEVLLCEGDEDLDRFLLSGGVLSEQVKAYTGGLSITDRVVRDSLRKFLQSYVILRQRGEERKFVFTTTAYEKKKRSSNLTFDLLEEWQKGTRSPEVIASLRSLIQLPEKDPNRGEIEAALTWLDSQAMGWAQFMDSVEWSFGSPDLEGIRQTIRNRLASQAETRFLPLGDDLLDRLIVRVLDTHIQEEPSARTLTRKHLSELIDTFKADVGAWAASPMAERIRAVFSEAAQVKRLLHDYADSLPPNASPAKLLTASYEVIPFDENRRHNELDLLASWCNSDERLSVLLLTGEGGTGKTRLMIEWCRRLRHQNWHAGFLRKDRNEGDLDPLLEGSTPRLVVVDYAETRVSVVEPFLLKMGLSLSDGEGPKLRVVLLARRKTDWWKNLSLSNRETEDLILRSPEPQQIKALVSPSLAERRQAFDDAVDGFTRQLGQSVENLHVPDLTHNDFDRALYLHMAALAAVLGEQIDTVEDALDHTLTHERRFWQNQVDSLGLDRPQSNFLYKALEISAAAITLIGGTATLEQTRLLLRRTLKSLSLPPHHLAIIESLLKDLYWDYSGKGFYLEPLQPDLLGEEWIARKLDQEEGLLKNIISGAIAAERYSILTVLTRLARRRPNFQRWIGAALRDDLDSLAEIALDVAVDTGDPAGVELAKELESTESVELILRLQKRQHQERYNLSIPLREVRLITTKKALAYRMGSSRDTTDEQEEEIAVLCNNLGLALRDLGRSEESLAPLIDAVDFNRRLAERNPSAFLHHLPLALGNLGEALSDLRRHEDALRCTFEAVGIYRKLVKERGEQFSPLLATYLGNLGGRFADLGMTKEALAATQEAVNILRGMRSFPSAHLALTFVKILKNLANRLSDVGQRRDALTTAESVVSICREFASRRPDIFDVELASTLNNLGNRLDDAGRPNDGVLALDEATTIYRHLSKQRPEAFLSRLSMSLSNLGGLLSKLGRHKEALADLEESLQITIGLSKNSPTRYRKEIAGTLINIGTCCGALGLRGKAEEALRESVELHRILAEEQPSVFAAPLYLALNNLGDTLRKLRRPYEAIEVLMEAAAVSKKIPSPHPERALSLANLGLSYRDIGDFSGASNFLAESIKYLRPFFLREPSHFRAWMKVIIKEYRTLQELRGEIVDLALTAEVERLLSAERTHG